jgi:uncharacterized SAM-binding protein YcdF (DUF218 family)
VRYYTQSSLRDASGLADRHPGLERPGTIADIWSRRVATVEFMRPLRGAFNNEKVMAPVTGIRKWVVIAVGAWLVLVGLPTIPAVRVFLAAPLVVGDPEARGDACYILAGGDAFRERLVAASDLYHMGRIPRIIFMLNEEWDSYNFVAQASWTPTQWALDFLDHRGVPKDRISVIAYSHGTFGTLTEARNLKEFLPAGIKRLVLVSSAPHMRRSMLAFRRILPQEVVLVPYPATDFYISNEYYHPLWLEYLKLAVYEVVAR